MSANCDKCGVIITDDDWRCGQCYGTWCAACRPNTYKCESSWHHDTVEACDNCIDTQFSQIIDGKYYCPECPSDYSTDEYYFKEMVVNARYEIIEMFLKRCGTKFVWCSYKVDKKILNDPVWWQDYKANPEQVKKKVMEMICGNVSVETHFQKCLEGKI